MFLVMIKLISNKCKFNYLIFNYNCQHGHGYYTRIYEVNLLFSHSLNNNYSIIKSTI